ncbi:leucine-rich repeat-containing protein 49-like [Acipenser oxyrinchus oxyrinchus]|uniref:Leucine-rich repeat-containing protein 49-like n=1 Tax=Acipenser oxyrinchus oxyrinchus TaxID=40147 RepID=A0AAD8CYT5_ACIOX|nr:leucine-rich repeat-containing protein 49-like [Acipenser oxyrinchus oxyrinchus]
MLPHKYCKGRLVAHTVNGYGLQLAIQRRTSQKQLDFSLGKDMPSHNREPTQDNLRSCLPRTEGRLMSTDRPPLSPKLAYASEFIVQERAAPQALRSPCLGSSGDASAQSFRSRARQVSHSAGTSPSNSNGATINSANEHFVKSLFKPGTSVFLRSPEDSAANPDRLDLDRRNLLVCPLLEGEENLQLLNFQHNLISEIQHLSHLRRLIFLDLYDNHITEISGLSALTSLRVLMLGTNRISRISGLESLSKLDVLDLHGNQISKMENLSHLLELRVLNLAGNNIVCVEELKGLNSLIELNLRRNHITTVRDVDCLPNLQRLFLSCNSITIFEDIACLSGSPSLIEVSLDENPIAQESWYKQTALRYMVQLRQLDMKRITDEERRMASVIARKEEEKKKEGHKQAIQKEKRRLAIQNAASQWQTLIQDRRSTGKSCLELPAQNGSKEQVSPVNGTPTELFTEEPRRLSPAGSAERLPEGREGSERRPRAPSRPSSPRDARSSEGAGGPSMQCLSVSDSHLAELDGETLRLFGLGALEALERGWGVQTAGAVTAITFRYIDYDAIVPTLPRIRVRFPNVTHLIFSETNVHRLPQLAALAQVRRLDQLTVHPEGNPVVSLALWRSFAIFRLSHFNLQRINGEEVTMNDVIMAEKLFGTLAHIAAAETPHYRLLLLLGESRKHQLQFLLEGRGREAGLSPVEFRENRKLLGEGLGRAIFNYPSRDGDTDRSENTPHAGQERAQVSRCYVQGLVREAASTNLKGESLHKLWSSLFMELVRDSVVEMRDRPAFRRDCLRRISESK